MNPSSNKSPESGTASGFNLPTPVEAIPQPVASSNPIETTPNTVLAAAGPERAPSSAASGATAVQPVMPVSPIPLPTNNSGQDTSSDVTGTSKSSSSKKVVGGLIKDDDLIEKSWVDKAKKIVEQTKNDPRQQSEELTMFRADYMKQHYNKTIKVNK